MRQRLRQARLSAGLTQKDVAKTLGISVTAYQNIEYGKATGTVAKWDKLEDLFAVNQRVLRENVNHSVF